MANRKRNTHTASRKGRRAAKRPADPQTPGDPAAVTFEGIGINPEGFSDKWDHARGFAARIAAVILSKDDGELEKMVARTGDNGGHTFMDAHDLLAGEIKYLKLHTEMLDKACIRMLCVAHRFKDDPRWNQPRKEAQS